MSKGKRERETKKQTLSLFFLKREEQYKQGEQEAGGEADSPPSRQPDAGLDPRTLRS